jgi:hypothetical protein
MPDGMPEQCQPEPEPVITPDTNISGEHEHDLLGFPKAEKKPKRKTQLPSDWQPSPANILHAATKGLTDKEISDEADRFRDHHWACGSVMSDWDAAWRKWVSNFNRFTGHRVADETGTRPRTGGYGHSIASVVAKGRIDGSS